MHFYMYMYVLIFYVYPLFLPLFGQAIEFFFFAVCIGVLALVFAVMSFFYKYVDLSSQNGSPNNSVANSQLSDETRALILSQGDGKLDDQSVPNYTDDKGNESEF